MIYFIMFFWILFGGGEVISDDHQGKFPGILNIETNLTEAKTGLSENKSEKLTEVEFETQFEGRFKNQNESLSSDKQSLSTKKMVNSTRVENGNFTDEIFVEDRTEQFHNQSTSKITNRKKYDFSSVVESIDELKANTLVNFLSSLVQLLPSSDFSSSSKTSALESTSVVSATRNPHFVNEEDNIYQWSIEDHSVSDSVSIDDPEEVYYSVYPEFREIVHFNENRNVEFNERELRSISEELLSSFTQQLTSVDTQQLTSVVPHSSSQFLNESTPELIFNIVGEATISNSNPILTSPTQNQLTSTTFSENIHSNTHKIDDIINGLAHLLGDNLKVANSTTLSHSLNKMYTAKSTRINNRGPPSFVNDNEGSSSTQFSSLASVPEDSTTLDISTSVLLNESSSTSSNLNSIVTTSEIVSSHTKLEIKSTSDLVASSTTASITNSFHSPSSAILSTRTNPESSIEEFIPTGPITAWKPVFQYNLETHHSSTKIPAQSNPSYTGNIYHTQSNHQGTVTKSTNFENNLQGIAISPTSTSKVIPISSENEELDLITAESVDNGDFVDIVLTATGVMNGAIPPKPTTMPIISTQSSIAKNDQSVYINGRRQYFTLQQQSNNWKGEVSNGNVPPKKDEHDSSVTSPVLKVPTTTPAVFKRTQTLPTVRIDTCIVGDDSSCDIQNHEVCRTENGVSSCLCPPSMSRDKSSNECVGVVTLLMYLRIDRFNNKRIFFETPILSDSSQREIFKNEVEQAINSLFKSSSLAPIYFESFVNTFYAVGGKLAANISILLHESVYTSNSLIKQVITRELLATFEQKNHTIGTSRLSVDTLLNPIQSINDFNECADSELHDCSVNAECENIFGSFKCNCFPGYTDKFPHDALKRGRICTACSSDYCSNHGICVLSNGKAECRCKGSYIGSKCEIDSEVLGVALGASLAALLIIILTFICLCMWSRRWKKEQHKPQLHSASPSFTYMDKTTKNQCDLHTLVSDNTLQWFPMRDTRSNFYLTEPPECSQTTLSRPLTITQPPSGMITRPSHLSHSQTKLLGSDDCINEDARFYVPRPKARSRTREHQNIYSDLDTMHEDELSCKKFHQSSAVSNAFYMHNLRSYY